MNSSIWRWPALWASLWLAALIPFIVSPLDLEISAAFYHAGEGSWEAGNAPLFRFIYMVGVYPAVTLGLISLIVFVFSFDVLALRRYRKVTGYFLANLALGPLLIINVICKGMAGRPRPVEVTEFGGTLPFEQLFHLNLETYGKSMGSGHASMGFVLFALVFLVKNRRWRRGIGIFAFTFGMLIGLARVAQGGHFASDVLLAGMVCWGLALGLAKAMRLEDGLLLKNPSPVINTRRVASLKRFAMSGAIFLATASFICLALPREKSGNAHLTPDQGVLVLDLEGTVHLTGRNDSKTRVRSELTGFGSPKSTMRMQTAPGEARQYSIGLFSEKIITNWLEIPKKNAELTEIHLSPRVRMVVVREAFNVELPLKIHHCSETPVRLEVDAPQLEFIPVAHR